MTAIDDRLVQSENHVTDAMLSMSPGDPLRSAIQANLALTAALHANTLAIVAASKQTPVDSSELAKHLHTATMMYINDGNATEGLWPFVARHVLRELGIEDAAW